MRDGRLAGAGTARNDQHLMVQSLADGLGLIRR